MPVDNTYGHLPPQALDLERVVLGALMIDKDAFAVVSEMLHPETFYEPRHQKIYTAIRSLNMDEKPVDIMTVTEQLKRDGTIDDVGGAPYVVELSSQVASSAQVNCTFSSKTLNTGNNEILEKVNVISSADLSITVSFISSSLSFTAIVSSLIT